MILFCIPVFCMANNPPPLPRGAELLQKAAGSAEYGDIEMTGTPQEILRGAIVGNIIGYIKILLQVLGVVFLVIVIYAGVLWMTAGGNQEKAGTARKWIINGVIGMITVGLSWAIALFIENLIRGNGG